jgi:hypothetical protein
MVERSITGYMRRILKWANMDIDGCEYSFRSELRTMSPYVQEVLLPAAVVAFEQALQAALTAGAEERRRAKDALAKVSPACEGNGFVVRLLALGWHMLMAGKTCHVMHMVTTGMPCTAHMLTLPD